MVSDEELVYQSKRSEIYSKYVQQLLDKDLAYKCYCSTDRLDKMREEQMKQGVKPRYDGACKHLSEEKEGDFVIRFKNLVEGAVSFEDAVRGDISIGNDQLDDFIIQRSDGNVTYNFCVVIDDALMKISHVIRGEDHINNTPRQINLYEALGFPIPTFAHLSMIHGEDGKKLSKRHGAQSVVDYKEMGILPQGMINFLLRLGWSCGDKEIFSIKEMKELFDLDHITKSAAIFNNQKLDWTNQQHINLLSKEELYKEVSQFLESEYLKYEFLADIAMLYANNCTNLKNLANSIKPFAIQPETSEEMKEKFLDDKSKAILKSVVAGLESLEEWNKEKINECIKAKVGELEVGFAKVAKPLRVAVIGIDSSPNIGDIFSFMPKEEVVNRVKRSVGL
jgi:glutamyl-tRNA synthetase